MSKPSRAPPFWKTSKNREKINCMYKTPVFKCTFPRTWNGLITFKCMWQVCVVCPTAKADVSTFSRCVRKLRPYPNLYIPITFRIFFPVKCFIFKDVSRILSLHYYSCCTWNIYHSLLLCFTYTLSFHNKISTIIWKLFFLFSFFRKT